jgi:hypothetical protein
MSKITLNFGSTPPNEDCAQVGQDDYIERAQRECEAYIAQLKRTYATVHSEHLPESVKLRMKSHSHDFGTYYEVVATFDENDVQACAAAFWLDDNVPLTWDAQAISQFQI